MLAFGVAAAANGGTLRLARAPAGPFAVTVYTSPTPLRPGLVDVSVAVEWAESGDTEPNARVLVAARSLDAPGAVVTYEASRERATDPSFYAADVLLPTAGRWQLDVQVLTRAAEGAANFEVEVPALAPATPAGPAAPRRGPVDPRPAGVAWALGLAAIVGGGVLAWRRFRGARG